MGQRDGFRVPRMAISEQNVAVLHVKNPWMPMWWSAALPGLGHLCEGAYIKGVILMTWEILVNFKAHLNLAILHTFTGDFAKAKEVINAEWALIYGVIFCFAIHDSYRRNVEMDMLSRLERRQRNRHYKLMRMSSTGINYLDRGNPWVAAAWSALLTGFGHIYNMKSIKGLILLGWMVAIIHFSHVNDAIIATFTGQFHKAREMVNYQWLLFFPSLYLFAMWDAYNDAVEMNKLFAEEQKQHLKKMYGYPFKKK